MKGRTHLLVKGIVSRSMFWIETFTARASIWIHIGKCSYFLKFQKRWYSFAQILRTEKKVVFIQNKYLSSTYWALSILPSSRIQREYKNTKFSKFWLCARHCFLHWLIEFTLVAWISFYQRKYTAIWQSPFSLCLFLLSFSWILAVTWVEALKSVLPSPAAIACGLWFEWYWGRWYGIVEGWEIQSRGELQLLP